MKKQIDFFICKIQGTNVRLGSDKAKELVRLVSDKSTKWRYRGSEVINIQNDDIEN